MDKEKAIQTLSNLIDVCVNKGGVFESINEGIMCHNALIVLAQAASQASSNVPTDSIEDNNSSRD